MSDLTIIIGYLVSAVVGILIGWQLGRHWFMGKLAEFTGREDKSDE